MRAVKLLLFQHGISRRAISIHHQRLDEKLKKELEDTAALLTAKLKGVLAADESVKTIQSRFDPLKIKNTEENRRQYRQVITSLDKEASKYISGMILHHETVTQKTDKGKYFVDVLSEKGIIPGVKVDLGTVPLMGTHREVTTQGLDNLDERLKEYKKMGCKFTKWRCVLKITPHTPTFLAIHENANVLARYASISQMNGMVPIVEPEILSDGDHDMNRCAKITEKVLAGVYKALSDHHMYLEGTLLKVAMLRHGHAFKAPPLKPEEIAEWTLKVLKRTVPPAVPGILFLSGGMSEEEANVNLNAINQLAKGRYWPLTFSYGRALLASCLRYWGGKKENQNQASDFILKRAKGLSQACVGQYVPGSVKTFAGKRDLFVKDYRY